MKRIFFLVLAMMLSYISGAQLCTGSLGDPVVHITFGTGGNPGSSLAAASTSYNFTNAECPNDGEYTVRNSSTGCFSATWHAIPQDHTTGDNQGYFMLVNASFNPGDFYVDTVRGLCANTTYVFAAWVMNVLKNNACGSNGIDPNLTFRVETTTGTVLATYNSGNLPEDATATWKEYGLFFQTPPGITAVVVRITNNAPGGCGNDLALDDITFRPCGPAVSAMLNITGNTTAAVCEGDNSSFLLKGNYPGGYNDPAFQWQVSINNGPFADIGGANGNEYLRLATGPGSYRYRLTAAENENMASQNCRVASNIITIEVNPLPVAQVTALTEACYGTDVVLNASGGATYQWTGPNGFSATGAQVAINDVDFDDAGVYSVTVTTDKGCSAEDEGTLVVRPPVGAAISGNNHLCEGTSVLLEASGGTSYTWSPAAGLSATNIPNPLASPADTVTYKVVVQNDFGCKDSAEIQLNVWKKPRADAGPDKITREGIPVTLSGAASGTDISWHWTPAFGLNDADILKPTAVLAEDRHFTLTAVSNKGCGIHADEVFVKVYKQVVIPNAFSPNGDGTHDTWQIQAIETYPNPEVSVFNRYGQAVFRSKGYGKAWDGKFNGSPLPVGTYYYVIDLKIPGEPVLNGWVVIVR